MSGELPALSGESESVCDLGLSVDGPAKPRSSNLRATFRIIPNVTNAFEMMFS